MQINIHKLSQSMPQLTTNDHNSQTNRRDVGYPDLIAETKERQ